MLVSKGIALRAFRKGDEPGLADLYFKAIGRPIEETYWHSKLLPRHSTVDNVWLVEDSAGRPIFHYAGLPTRFLAGRQEVQAMVAVDAMTAPEHRRRGLLTEAVASINSTWRDGGVAFVIGLPNGQWGSRVRALGWRTLFPLQWLIRPLRPEALLARRLRIPCLKRIALSRAWNGYLRRRLPRDASLSTESVERAGDEFEAIWELCKADAACSAVRDRAWVEWRFLAPLGRKYTVAMARRSGRPAGYAAYRLLKSGNRISAVLADILSPQADRRVRDSLLHDVIEQLLPTGAESLATLAVPGTEHFRWLRRAGFLTRQSFSVEIIPLTADLPIALLERAANWRLNGADFDVV